jgi:probable O-glycosylation ligase (exosortase A-associated)
MTGLRDYILLLVLGGLVPISFLRPWIGILGWFWIAYMVPHSLMWGFGRSIPLAALVGGATLLGFIFTKDRKPLPRSWTVLFVLLFIVHMTISTVLSFSPELAWHKWNWVSKIFLMTLVTLCLFQDRERLRYLYLVPALGLGFWGFKGGIWVLRTGGGSRLWGPDFAFFADNNTFGLALAMVLPMLLYLSRDEPRRWLKNLMKAMFGLTIVTIIFTYSRGAFLGLIVVLGVLIWRSPWRLRFATVVIVTAFLAAPFAPVELKDRMNSISDQESAQTRDKSSAGRIEAWHTAWGVATAHPFFGEGFKALWNTEIWNTYFGNDYLVVRDVHSLYFEILSEHGILGMVIYMAILLTTLGTLRHVRKRWRGDPEHGYLSNYAEMTELSIYPFLVAGAFLGVAYFDLYLLLVGTSTLLGTLSRQAENASVTAVLRPAGEDSSRLQPRSPGLAGTVPRARPKHA